MKSRFIMLSIIICICVCSMTVFGLEPVPQYGTPVDGWYPCQNINHANDWNRVYDWTSTMSKVNDPERGEVVKWSKNVVQGEWFHYVPVHLLTKVLSDPVGISAGTDVSIEFWLKTQGKNEGGNWSDLRFKYNTSYHQFADDNSENDKWEIFRIEHDGSVLSGGNRLFNDLKLQDNEWRKFKFTFSKQPDSTTNLSFATKVNENDQWTTDSTVVKLNNLSSIEDITVVMRNAFPGGQAASAEKDVTLSLLFDDFVVDDGIEIEEGGPAVDSLEGIYK